MFFFLIIISGSYYDGVTMTNRIIFLEIPQNFLLLTTVSINISRWFYNIAFTKLFNKRMIKHKRLQVPTQFAQLY